LRAGADWNPKNSTLWDFKYEGRFREGHPEFVCHLGGNRGTVLAGRRGRGGWVFDGDKVEVVGGVSPGMSMGIGEIGPNGPHLPDIYHDVWFILEWQSHREPDEPGVRLYSFHPDFVAQVMAPRRRAIVASASEPTAGVKSGAATTLEGGETVAVLRPRLKEANKP